MAEITPKGYLLKTQNEWFDEEKQLYVNIDPDWNLDPSTPDGLKIAHDAEVFGALDEVLQQAYNSKDPNKASGYDLDIVSAITGTKRSEGTASTITGVVLTGVPTTTIVPAGTRFKSATTGTVWTLDQTWTLDSTGKALVSLTANSVGATEANSNTITQIVDTVAGLTSVNNPSPATPGTGVESDSSLRVKRATAVGRPGNNQLDSMLGELFAVDGIRRVHIYENDNNTTDSNGLPAHSIAPIVDGGLNEDVALAIYLKKNPGVMLYTAGTAVSVNVASPVYPTNIKTIKFSRPIYVDMLISVNIKDDGTLPSQGTLAPMIQDAIIEYAAGGLIPTEYGFKPDGFDIGETVPYSSLYTPINKIIGYYGNSYVQSMTLNGSTTNVTIAFNQLSRWTTSNITVNIV
jgi:uncharacterized phage protein gp47/JayE